MTSTNSKLRISPAAGMELDESLKGFEIDGYRIVYSRRVTLMPVDLVHVDNTEVTDDDKQRTRSIGYPSGRSAADR
ncbi:MAG: hypothetical protein R3C53_00655 [Pirellulaceae bacterium]